MRVTATVYVLGKVAMPWKDKQDMEHISYTANFMQNNGEIIDKLRLTQEQYNKVEAKKEYLVTADYGTGSNGGYLRLVDITEKSK